MEYKEFKAKTVNDAITEATVEFGITSNMLDYVVIEEGSTGLLGLFSKSAIIKARPKEEPEEEYSIRDEFQSSSSISLKSAGGFKKEQKKDKKKEPNKEIDSAKAKKAEQLKKQDFDFEQKQDDGQADDVKVQMTITSAKAARVSDDAQGQKDSSKEARGESRRESLKGFNKGSKDVKAEGKKNLEKPYEEANVPAAEHRIITGAEAENQEINDILKLIFEKLEIEAKIESSIDLDDKVLNINITGENTSDLIGKKGQTLDAIQYIISIIINKKKGDYYRVKVDTNNYRERRQKTLENQAKNVASKVRKTRRKVVMEPMNPYERRVIHAYLQSDKSVTTKSEGEEPNRRVVVYYKK